MSASATYPGKSSGQIDPARVHDVRPRSLARSIAIRTAAEIECIRAAGSVVRAAIDAAAAACAPGASTRDLDAAASAVLGSRGAAPLFPGQPSPERGDACPFPATVCVSVNDEVLHGVPGSREIRDGDVVSIDCGAMLDGWCADAAITVVVGDVDLPRLRMVETANRMLDTAIAMIRPGVAWSTVATRLQAIAAAAGLGTVVEYVGHGIGRRLHELPEAPCVASEAFRTTRDFTLRPGMVLAVEPVVTLGSVVDAGLGGLRRGLLRVADDGWTLRTCDGLCGCHAEHTLAVTPDGADVLTDHSPRSSRTGGVRCSSNP